MSRAGWDGMSPERQREVVLDSIYSTNYVVTARVTSREIDVQKIARMHPGAIFNIKTFAALIMRLAAPRTTCSVYKTGMIACMGARTLTQSVRAMHKFAAVIQRLNGGFCRLESIRIGNVVATALAFPIDRMRLATDFNYAVKFGGTFPGASIHCEHLPIVPKTKIVCEGFYSGKFNITAAKTFEEAVRVFTWLYDNVLIRVRMSDAAAGLAIDPPIGSLGAYATQSIPSRKRAASARHPALAAAAPLDAGAFDPDDPEDAFVAASLRYTAVADTEYAEGDIPNEDDPDVSMLMAFLRVDGLHREREDAVAPRVARARRDQELEEAFQNVESAVEPHAPRPLPPSLINAAFY